MDILVNHLSEIITVSIAIISALYTGIKSISSKHDDVFNSKIEYLRKEIVDVAADLLRTQGSIVGPHEIRKMESNITAILTTITNIRIDSLNKNDEVSIYKRLDELLRLVQITREQIARGEASDIATHKHLEETIRRLQLSIDETISIPRCDLIRSNPKSKC